MFRIPVSCFYLRFHILHTSHFVTYVSLLEPGCFLSVSTGPILYLFFCNPPDSGCVFFRYRYFCRCHLFIPVLLVWCISDGYNSPRSHQNYRCRRIPSLSLQVTTLNFAVSFAIFVAVGQIWPRYRSPSWPRLQSRNITFVAIRWIANSCGGSGGHGWRGGGSLGCQNACRGLGCNTPSGHFRNLLLGMVAHIGVQPDGGVEETCKGIEIDRTMGQYNFDLVLHNFLWGGHKQRCPLGEWPSKDDCKVSAIWGFPWRGIYRGPHCSVISNAGGSILYRLFDCLGQVW